MLGKVAYRAIKGDLVSAIRPLICLVGISSLAAGTEIDREVVPANTSTGFLENRGQWPSQVLFRAGVHGGTVWVTQSGLLLQQRRAVVQKDGREQLATARERELEPSNVEYQQQLVSMNWVNSNQAATFRPMDRHSYGTSIFKGSNPDDWRFDLQSFSEVDIEGLYPGVDLHLLCAGGELRYDFLVQPGADPAYIQLQVNTGLDIRIDETGNLIARSDWGEIRQTGLKAYSRVGSEEYPVSAAFSIGPGNVVTFDVAEVSDPRSALVIDPTLVFSTFLGGSMNDLCKDLALGADSSIYMTGLTQSTDFPAPNSLNDGQDVFVIKYAPGGDSIIYSAYLGGSDVEGGFGIDVNEIGNAFIVGYTSSTDFPVANPIQTDQFGVDAFITKVNTAGNGILYSTYIGGTANDWAYDVAVADPGFAYVTGYTSASDFPSVNAYQPSSGGFVDAFLCKLNFDGTAFDFSTYLGGSDWEFGQGIALGSDYSIYITGWTQSSDFPTVNPLLTYTGDKDVFLVKFYPDADSLEYGTFYGTSSADEGWAVAADADGNAYVTGYADSSGLPLVHRYQGYQGDRDGFVFKISATGSAWNYSTYIGGSSPVSGASAADDEFFGIDVKNGEAVLTGYTKSSDFPLVNSLQGFSGMNDLTVVRLSADGSTLALSTILGGSAQDNGDAVACLGNTDCWVGGTSYSSDFPTVNPLQSHSGIADVVLFLLSRDSFVCGDADGNGIVNISDAVYLISYIFGGGPAPLPDSAGDADCNGIVNISDAVYLIAYIFGGGPAPCSSCP
jgi:hypothetical protein